MTDGAPDAWAVCARYEKSSRPYRAARQSKSLDSGHPLLVSLPLEHAVEGAPGELGALDAGGHVRDVLKLGSLVQVFQVFLGELNEVINAPSKVGLPVGAGPYKASNAKGSEVNLRTLLSGSSIP